MAELTRTRDELHRSNDSLAAFAGQVSHDLRTPLTAIMANAEMLADEPVVAADPGLAPLANELISASLRMASMIEEVLTYARISGRLSLGDTDLEVLIANVLNDLAPKLRNTQAHVQVGPMPIVQADAGQLYLVLLNLIDNAIKYSGDLTPQVTIGCRAEPDRWQVWVRDTGVGIADDRLEDVFLPFVRVGGAAEGVQGSGLGLDTVRRTIVAHGGKVGIDSTPGEGSIAWFELPRRPDAHNPDSPSDQLRDPQIPS